MTVHSHARFKPPLDTIAASERSVYHTTLIIDAPEAMALVDALPDRPSVVLAQYHQLGADLMARIRPDSLMVPLLRRDFDAALVIERLQAVGFTGQIYILCPPLPDCAMVAAELRAMSPGLNLTLIEIPA